MLVIDNFQYALLVGARADDNVNVLLKFKYVFTLVACLFALKSKLCDASNKTSVFNSNKLNTYEVNYINLLKLKKEKSEENYFQ